MACYGLYSIINVAFLLTYYRFLISLGADFATLQLLQKYGPAAASHKFQPRGHVPRSRRQLYQHGFLYHDSIRRRR
jgi:hypothetical protein